MISVQQLLEIKNISLLFLAPPAWGKTRMILDIYKNYQGKIYYISPLRALAEEFKGKFSKDELYLDDGNNFKIYAGTVENFLARLNNFSIKENDLLIIDEVHLFYLWDSFRDSLKKFRDETFSIFNNCLSLSATMDDELIKKFKLDTALTFSHNYMLDLGNMKLKNNPLGAYKVSDNKILLKILILSRLRIGRVILFVKYRRKVNEYLDWARRMGISSLGCVGGEAYQFSLEKKDDVQFFVATTVLSHGVNLPEINTAIISYELGDRKFFNQMLSRAGRRGEDFNVYFRDDNFIEAKKMNFFEIGVMFFHALQSTCFK